MRQEVSFDFEDSFRVPVQREEDDEDDDGMLFSSEDEETLIAELSHDGRVESDDDENAVKLIGSLEHSFTHYSNILVDDIAQTLVPAVRHVKEALRVLNTHVDDDFGKDLWEFHETCKKMEFTALNDAEEVKEQYKTAQVSVGFHVSIVSSMSVTNVSDLNFFSPAGLVFLYCLIRSLINPCSTICRRVPWVS
ncbi:hypothetical protein EDD18DRAFT_635812 [Armillaria luteobubalina]|uniref:Uncharacterized protein n=1 Tax=Armillaria luteobubalina TaxID=153913 RepID=A0AA39QJM6_9AGAR|nr:hypothetical protein EDD18DRAFT_635812 [Armillaria luteobubalina]